MPVKMTVVSWGEPILYDCRTPNKTKIQNSRPNERVCSNVVKIEPVNMERTGKISILQFGPSLTSDDS